MKHLSLKKLVITATATIGVIAAATIGASACTTLYVGGNLVEEGTPFVARTEDYGADMNKLWFISEAGRWKEGETYTSCSTYGAMEWTFTHDSYRFTHFTNDIYYDGICPECEQDVLTGDPADFHFSYTEFGTNEKGVSVSATETISGNSAVKAVDPLVKTGEKGGGIEETDIPTIILAEADSARAGVELLCEIYDTYGAYFESGLFICDQNEGWYIENCTGREYIAIKLNNDMIFIEPNIAIIGEIDLDDTENVIASDRLIEVAKQADSFVGDEEENIINFKASYANNSSGNARMPDGLKFLNPEKYGQMDSDDLNENNDVFTISNVKDGKLVPMYTNIQADRMLDKNDIFDFYKLSSIGKPSNQEIEIFQLFKDEPVETGTVGWVGVGNMSNNVFVPYYPLLLTDMYEGYQVSTPVVTQSAARPDGFCTWTTRNDGKFVVYPENWRDSYYFTFEGLGGYILYAEQITGSPISEENKQYVLNELDALQQQFIAEFEAMDPQDTTAVGMDMAERAHQKGLELIDYLQEVQEYKEFLKGLDYEQALADAEYLVNEIGVRLTGTQGEQAGLAYLEKQYEALGYEINRHDFTLGNRTSGDIYLGDDLVIAAGTPSKNDAYTGFTAGEIEGDFVYFETPAAALMPGDVQDKIVFFPGNFRTASPAAENTYRAVAALENAGASGVVVMMDPTTEDTERYQIRVTLPNFSSEAVQGWIGETPISVPLLITSGWDKEKVISYLEANSGATVKMDVRDHVDSQSLIATKKAAVDTDLTLYVTCHIDTVLPAPGASDNASGVVGTLAIARAMQDVETNYNIQFITFGAEEVGLQGAYAYCADMTEEDILNAIGNYNLDMVGTSDPACEYIFMNSSTSEELGYDTPLNDPILNTHVTDKAREAAQLLYNIDPDFYVDMNHYLTCYDRTTDHYALHQAGIPAVEFDWRANAAGTSFEPYYHTMKDDMDNFSITRLQQQVDVIALAVYDEATADYAAVVGEGVYRRYYDTMNEAVAAIEDGGVVKLLRNNNEDIEVAKEISFSLDLNGYDFTGSISAGDKYDMSQDGNTYTFTRESSSGGGSSSTTYAINVEDTRNGTVTVSPKRAERNDTVTVTVKPDDGYELDKLVITDQNGDEIDFTSKGNGKYTFTMPRSKVTVEATFTAVDEEETGLGFTDVRTSDWFYSAVEYMVDNSLMGGTSDTTFSPYTTLTRGMVAQILYAMEGRPAAEGSYFTDVADNAWYADAVNWAASEGIVAGVGENTFAPDTAVTREQLALILFNYVNRPETPSAELTFSDADSASAWSVDALKWAVGSGLISGKDNNMLDPQGTATRAEVAQIIANFIQAQQ